MASKGKKTTNSPISDILILDKETKGTYRFTADVNEGESAKFTTQIYILKSSGLEGLSEAKAIKLTVEVVETKDA